MKLVIHAQQKGQPAFSVVEMVNTLSQKPVMIIIHKTMMAVQKPVLLKVVGIAKTLLQAKLHAIPFVETDSKRELRYVMMETIIQEMGK